MSYFCPVQNLHLFTTAQDNRIKPLCTQDTYVSAQSSLPVPPSLLSLRVESLSRLRPNLNKEEWWDRDHQAPDLWVEDEKEKEVQGGRDELLSKVAEG